MSQLYYDRLCNITAPWYVAAARALRPGLLRVGGTRGDALFYNMTPGTTGATPAPAPYQRTLAAVQWDLVMQFARLANFTVAFGINAGAGPRAPGCGAWRAANLQQLLAYAAARNDTVSRGGPLVALEFGNEINLFLLAFGPECLPSGPQFAADYAQFHAAVAAVDPALRTVAYDVAFVPFLGSLDPEFVERALAPLNGTLGAFTWHFYPTMADTDSARQVLPKWIYELLKASPQALLDPKVLDRVGHFASEVQNLTAKLHITPGAELWLGETGSAVGGGQTNVSDRFVDGFEYLDKLGSAAAHGTHLVMRQCFCGYRYGLTNADQTANPSFFTTVLFKRLVGVTYLHSNSGAGAPDPMLRVHAWRAGTNRVGEHADAAANVTLTYVNLHNATGTITLPRPSAWTEYILQSEALESDTMLLNGQPLRLTATGDLPPLPGRPAAAPAAAISVPPLSYGFIILPMPSPD